MKETINDLHLQGERITPIDEIPPEFRMFAPLPGGDKLQVIDTRRCYTFHPEYHDDSFPKGAYLECINLAVDELD